MRYHGSMASSSLFLKLKDIYRAFSTTSFYAVFLTLSLDEFAKNVLTTSLGSFVVNAISFEI